MKPLLVLAICLGCALSFAQSMQTSEQRSGVSPKAEQNIMREVRHEILMLPYYGVFDAIGYTVNGRDVTLTGYTTRDSTKKDAEDAVKHIEGVEHVNNQIDILPPSPMDDRIRLAEFRAIYGDPALQRYDLGTIKPIRIIVKNGHVDLEGVVDSQGDKDIAGIRAKGVSGVFSVTDNLKVQKP
jgi:hyperosmotically inducible protein